MEQTAAIGYDVKKVRSEFPILSRMVNGHPLIYFDNAATTQKPKAVIDALTDYYSGYNANIHRGVHSLADEATQAYEASRSAVKDFLGARSEREIIFTSGTTDGINLVAYSLSETLSPGDEILVTGMEHHSNMVPWQIMAKRKGFVVNYVNLTDNGAIDLDDLKLKINRNTKLVSIVYASNSLGTINPVKEIIEIAHNNNSMVMLDAAQSVAHLEVNVTELDCDFMAFSGHKMYGPTGVGVLYGKEEIMENLPPWRGGGEMISEVTLEGSTWNELPYKFEAGTPNIADVIALKAAIDYINDIGKNSIKTYEDDLRRYATDQLRRLDDVRIYGDVEDKVSMVSFNITGVHPYDIGMMLDARGVAVRTGHHCTQPVMDRYEIEGTVRASFALYNTRQEIDVMMEGLKKIKSILIK